MLPNNQQPHIPMRERGSNTLKVQVIPNGLPFCVSGITLVKYQCRKL